MIHLKIQHLLPAFAALVSFGFMNAPTTSEAATSAPAFGVDADLTWEAVLGDSVELQDPQAQSPTKKVVTDEDNLLFNSLGMGSTSTSWPGLGTVAGLSVGSTGGTGGSASLTGGPTSAPAPIATPLPNNNRNYPRSGVVPPAPLRDISQFLP